MPKISRKNIIILKSASGAGKSTFAKLLCFNRLGWVSCEADSYFYDENNNYNFDIKKLGAAHKYCQDKFMAFLKEPTVECIVVSNTNTQKKDWKFYEDEAKRVGAQVTFLILENRHGGENVHGVPLDTLQKQKENILNNIQL